MENTVKIMDNFSTHVLPLPRRYPHPMPVETIGYVQQKRDYISHPFSTFNFSFIMSGGGDYHCPQGDFEVVPPMVITQWPGEQVSYGPCGRHDTWEELYFIYTAPILPLLQKMRYAIPERHCWQVSQVGPFQRAFTRFLEDFGDTFPDESVDDLDRRCEELVYLSLSDRPPAAMTQAQQVVRDIEQYLRRHLNGDICFDGLASRFNLSSSTLRRYWAESHPETPGDFLLRLRMQEACRMLIETRLSVAEIASHCGFADPLYFSRRFRQTHQHTATAYRQRHAIPEVQSRRGRLHSVISEES